MIITSSSDKPAVLFTRDGIKKIIAQGRVAIVVLLSRFRRKRVEALLVQSVEGSREPFIGLLMPEQE